VSAPTACSTIETADGSPAGSYKTYTTKAPKPYYCYPSIFETDYANGIYSFHRGFDEAYTTYNGSTTYEGDNAGNDVNGDYYWNYFDPLNSGQNYRLTQNGIYPLYWVQAMCSSTAGGPKNPLNPFNANSSPSYSSTGGYCWCRLRRRSNLQVGTYWVTLGANFTNCGRACANHCVGLTDHAEFKTLAFTGF
jgi:hypothetical protein